MESVDPPAVVAVRLRRSLLQGGDRTISVPVLSRDGAQQTLYQDDAAVLLYFDAEARALRVAHRRPTPHGLADSVVPVGLDGLPQDGHRDQHGVGQLSASGPGGATLLLDAIPTWKRVMDGCFGKSVVVHKAVPWCLYQDTCQGGLLIQRADELVEGRLYLSFSEEAVVLEPVSGCGGHSGRKRVRSLDEALAQLSRSSQERYLGHPLLLAAAERLAAGVTVPAVMGLQAALSLPPAEYEEEQTSCWARCAVVPALVDAAAAVPVSDLELLTAIASALAQVAAEDPSLSADILGQALARQLAGPRTGALSVLRVLTLLLEDLQRQRAAAALQAITEEVLHPVCYQFAHAGPRAASVSPGALATAAAAATGPHPASQRVMPAGVGASYPLLTCVGEADVGESAQGADDGAVQPLTLDPHLPEALNVGLLALQSLQLMCQTGTFEAVPNAEPTNLLLDKLLLTTDMTLQWHLSRGATASEEPQAWRVQSGIAQQRPLAVQVLASCASLPQQVDVSDTTPSLLEDAVVARIGGQLLTFVAWHQQRFQARDGDCLLDACSDLLSVLAAYINATSAPSVVQRVLMGAGVAMAKVEHMLRDAGEMAHWRKPAVHLLGALTLVYTSLLKQATTAGVLEYLLGHLGMQGQPCRGSPKGRAVAPARPSLDQQHLRASDTTAASCLLQLAIAFVRGEGAAQKLEGSSADAGSVLLPCWSLLAGLMGACNRRPAAAKDGARAIEATLVEGLLRPQASGQGPPAVLQQLAGNAPVGAAVAVQLKVLSFTAAAFEALDCYARDVPQLLAQLVPYHSHQMQLALKVTLQPGAVHGVARGPHPTSVLLCKAHSRVLAVLMQHSGHSAGSRLVSEQQNLLGILSRVLQGQDPTALSPMKPLQLADCTDGQTDSGPRSPIAAWDGALSPSQLPRVTAPACSVPHLQLRRLQLAGSVAALASGSAASSGPAGPHSSTSRDVEAGPMPSPTSRRCSRMHTAAVPSAGRAEQDTDPEGTPEGQEAAPATLMQLCSLHVPSVQCAPPAAAPAVPGLRMAQLPPRAAPCSTSAAAQPPAEPVPSSTSSSSWQARPGIDPAAGPQPAIAFLRAYAFGFDAEDDLEVLMAAQDAGVTRDDLRALGVAEAIISAACDEALSDCTSDADGSPSPAAAPAVPGLRMAQLPPRAAPCSTSAAAQPPAEPVPSSTSSGSWQARPGIDPAAGPQPAIAFLRAYAFGFDAEDDLEVLMAAQDAGVTRDDLRALGVAEAIISAACDERSDAESDTSTADHQLDAAPPLHWAPAPASGNSAPTSSTASRAGVAAGLCGRIPGLSLCTSGGAGDSSAALAAPPGACGELLSSLWRNEDLHQRLLQLCLQLLVLPSGLLSPAVAASDVDDARLQRTIGFLLEHLGRPEAVAVTQRLHAANLQRLEGAQAAAAGDGMARAVLRLLKLLIGDLYQAPALGPTLARGAYGTIRDAAWPGLRPEPVVVKVIDVVNVDDVRSFQRVHTEVTVLRHLSGVPGVIELLEYGLVPDVPSPSAGAGSSWARSSGSPGGAWHLVFPRYTCSLKQWRMQQQHLDLRRPQHVAGLLAVFQQVVDAVASLHDRGVVHFDIKCDNVLVDCAGGGCSCDGAGARLQRACQQLAAPPVAGLVLADFGDALWFPSGPLQTLQGRGTELFSSPEMLLLGMHRRDSDGFDRRRLAGAGTAHDVWSLGCSLYELLTGRVLFEQEGVPRILAALKTTDAGQPVLEATEERLLVQPELTGLLNWVLRRDARWRPGPREVSRRLFDLVSLFSDRAAG